SVPPSVRCKRCSAAAGRRDGGAARRPTAHHRRSCPHGPGTIEAPNLLVGTDAESPRAGGRRSRCPDAYRGPIASCPSFGVVGTLLSLRRCAAPARTELDGVP